MTRRTAHAPILLIALLGGFMAFAPTPRSEPQPGSQLPGTPAATTGPAQAGATKPVASGNSAEVRSGAPALLDPPRRRVTPRPASGTSRAGAPLHTPADDAGMLALPQRETVPAGSSLGTTQPRVSQRPRPSHVVPSAAATPLRTPRPTAKSGVVSRQLAIRTTWYCRPPTSRCTVGFDPAGMYAAISPDLRSWTGRLVRVRYGAASVVVRVIDCDCATEHGIDLFSSAFRRLAPLSAGEIAVTLELLR